jgi:molybdopterin/thiamine biosynthesis adenylyltransferase/ubiquitin-protein ligase
LIWWLTDPARLKTEIAELEALRDRERWLLSVEPELRRDLRLAVEFGIDLHGEALHFTLEYPAFFPDTPPSVRPHDRQRLSSHQYGSGGELCLEFRSDNWDPSITGAAMVESAHRLLTGERPASDARAIVPSAHQSTLGQRLRGTVGRFLLTRTLREFTASLRVGDHRACQVGNVFGPKRTWMAYVAAIGPVDNPEWRENTIPVRSDTPDPALLLRVDSLEALRVDIQALDALTKTALGSESLSSYVKATTRHTILADQHSASLFYSFLADGEWTVLQFATIDLTLDSGPRLDHQYTTLRAKKAGLLGCGSLGSKMATSLARSGVGDFVLVDDDILKPGNLVRHDLDGNSIGAHKADALEGRLRAISPAIDVQARRVILGGQESSGTTASVLDELATCDILIDATADPQAFNLLASVARSAARPMIWAEVFAGGVGGFVARLRPDIEPPPHKARQQYLAWCEQEGVPWGAADAGRYDAQGDAGPIIADDADVTLIATPGEN